ncbi:Calponin homology domain-containing protein 2 [Phytophthora infestans]|uniref:Calponin homology domain-containing protein 2 n=1 Tax=Phytophthora infestans TaxID=4787 RepID=A0A833TJE5_PHYIN|nr:Calponin homology domain-containing protein 2 [Phytophthora infestans]
MSALLLRWLNDDLKLQRKVEVLERDVSNGYIIAEVLHLQGLEPKLEQYDNSSTTAAKIHNMELLGERFEALGIPFSVNTRRAIMMENRSAVLQFLLQLKDFLGRRSNRRPESARAKVIPSDQATKTAAAIKSNLPPHDVEERFLMDTMKKYQPKDIRFYKDIDMAVHLRKFQQAQWQAENEHDRLNQQIKVDKNANAATGYAATRAHLQEKAQFLREWDREHLEKWKHTQRLFLSTERDDLRLELTLEARRQIYAEEKLAETQQDGVDGVVDFKKNMNRLGLASSGTDLSLRAIPANDEGARAHFHGLEKRVEDLDFRPSNNVKMMKELRKRRKAQLAAEKDRRMRRQKALADQKKSIEAHERGQLNDDQDDFQDPEASNSTALPEKNGEVESIVNPREKYLDEKREELEENYARLRESGSMRREEDMKVLDGLRTTKREKEYLRACDVCSGAVDDLISLAFAIVSVSDRDMVDIEPLKRETFFPGKSSRPTCSDQGGEEMRYELDVSIQNFLCCSEVWATLPLQSRFSTYDVKSDIQALGEGWANPTVALDTSWCRPLSFILLSVFTEDESGSELAQRVATEHHLTFLQLDALADECVKTSYEPQKLGDQVASLCDRERELGVFGPKITALRLKNAPLPDSLAVEIIAKAVSLCRREASESPLDDTLSSALSGCMLHNYPRTVDEAKLLEKSILADLLSEESDSNNATSSTALPEEESVPAIVSVWDCVLSISPDESSVTDQADADKTLLGSDSSTALVDKPTSSGSKIISAESQRKLALEEEQRVRSEEQRANLENFWGQTTRHIRIKRLGLHRDVSAELTHLCIDVYTQTSYKTIPMVIECGVEGIPEQLEKSLHHKIQEPMATIRSVIQAISTLAATAHEELEKDLFSGAEPFQDLLDQAATKLKATNGASKLERRERILTELEVSLGDMADSHRVAGNEFVDAFTQDPFPEVMGAVDIVYKCLPSICFFLKDFALQKLELLRTRLYDRIPFLSDSSQDSVSLSKILPREAMDAATDLGGDKAGGGESAQAAGDEVLSILSQVAAEYSFHLTDEHPACQYALSETSVTSEEITRLLQHVTLLCRFGDRLRQSTGQLYAGDVQYLMQTVQEDIHMKDKAIAEVMADIRAHGHATWSIRGLEISPQSGIATHLTRSQKQNFLTIPQLSALAHACEKWELSNPITAKAFGGETIASDVFVALVLEVAAKEDFPVRWRDASAVAAVTLQQCSTRGAVSWRKFIWSLMCVQFKGTPSLEDILCYQRRAMILPAIKRQRQDAILEESCNFFLSRTDFWNLSLWFEERCNIKAKHEAEQCKELVFQLFSRTTDQVDLIPMLLCWCVHPSCSFSVRHDLEEFAPRYSRGLYRVFRLLCQYSAVYDSTAQSVSSLCGSGGLDHTPSLESFDSFYHGCSSDLPRFYLLQNPLEALVQP